MLNFISNKETIIEWLKEENEEKLEKLWSGADSIRKKSVGDEIHLRGLIEVSNYCGRECTYCGIHVANKNIERYRMDAEEIVACALKAVKFGYGTVVMQAGEDYGIEAQWLADIIKTIKKQTPLAVTLSLGERSIKECLLWKNAGANRYLLRFETTDMELYHRIHPAKKGIGTDNTSCDNTSCNLTVNPRIKLLKELRENGYEIGSGVMIGIPGQTYDTLANDILTFGKMDLDMIGVGPYIEHPNSLLAQNSEKFRIKQEDQVKNTELMTYKALALTRLICPEANIPSTTALATINKESGRKTGLTRGANIVMPNLTPLNYRKKYEIYPNKAGAYDTAEDTYENVRKLILSLGRFIGIGHGSRKSGKANI